MTRDESFPAVSDALRSARSIAELLELITEKARELVGAHQATTSVVFGEDWAKAVHAVSLSDKYAAWRTYDQRPDGSGIYRMVCQLNRPMRLTQAELDAQAQPLRESPVLKASNYGRVPAQGAARTQQAGEPEQSGVWA